MNKKQFLLLLALLLIIASLAFVQKNLDMGSYRTKEVVLTSSSLSLVDTIRITQREKNTILQKQGGVWMLTSPSTSSADTKKVEDLLGRIKLLTKSEIVTTNKDTWDVYGVDATGLRIELLENNKKVFGYVLGKVSEDYTSVYLRQDDENTVYRSKGLLRDEFTVDSSFFRSKELTNFSEKDIAEIIVKKGNKKINITHNGAAWESVPKSKESASVPTLGSLLLQLRILSFPTNGPIAAEIQTSPEYKIFLSRSNKDLKSIIFYVKRDGGTLYGSLEGSTEVFTLDLNTASMLDKLFQ